jgi:predicted LPLAT superfamily acyltransferase
MEKKWDGKTRGSLWGYRFFVWCIQFFGPRLAYFFCYFVSAYFILFAAKPRKGLLQFYRVGLGYGRLKSLRTAARTFNVFGRVLIDRIALKTKRKEQYSFTFENEHVLLEMHHSGRGGFLFSGHVGNWENAGNLIADRITGNINVLMLDAEVEQIKKFIEENTEATKYKLIPLREDMSHLIKIHSALKQNELVALLADRTISDQKSFRLPFLGGYADFPSGPFIMVQKFKVPVTFVFALKTKGMHYALSATTPLDTFATAEDLAKAYVKRLEELVKANPEQWFNFYSYYAD